MDRRKRKTQKKYHLILIMTVITETKEAQVFVKTILHKIIMAISAEKKIQKFTECTISMQSNLYIKNNASIIN